MLKRDSNWRAVVVGAVAIFGSVWVHFTRAPVGSAAAAPQLNFPAPEISLTALDRQQLSLSALRGQIILLNFWATWCGPCRAEMPEIQFAYQTYRARNITVLAVDIAEDEDVVARFVQELNLSFPVLIDRDGAISKRYNVRALPTTFFIDRAGMIRMVQFGQMDRAFITAQLAPLLAEQ